jgi:hypothetical protein
MEKLKSGFVLTEGENVVVELEAELWATGSNPIQKFFGKIMRLLYMIIGYRKKSFLVITDRRVVEISSVYNCWVFNTGKEVKYVLPSSVKELGYIKETTCGVFCPAYYLYYQSTTQSTAIQLSADEKECQAIVDAFYNALSK